MVHMYAAEDMLASVRLEQRLDLGEFFVLHAYFMWMHSPLSMSVKPIIQRKIAVGISFSSNLSVFIDNKARDSGIGWSEKPIITLANAS